MVNGKQLQASSCSSVCLSARNSPTATWGIFVKFHSDLGYNPTQITDTQNADPRTLLTISTLLSSSLLRQMYDVRKEAEETVDESTVKTQREFEHDRYLDLSGIQIVFDC